ncbi:MAG: right-handed parallel beta-helix repeat-containing protein [Dysgonamonadaceae bacterium]|jgi:hypothetical protein|nr:right-handed parallel beta-helix repeat-containing protein [Dysgonamonadaceae bacterium]
MKRKLIFSLLAVVLCTGAASAVQTTRYVKESSTGNGDGATWADASADLQAIINASAAGDVIFVAAGTYKPIYTAVDWNSANNSYPATNGNRDNAFVLKEGVKIYGGFPTHANDAEHTTTDSRTLSSQASQTILSGDIDGTFGISDADAYHVVIGANIADDGETILDGFTVTGGNANAGGGITVNGVNIEKNSGGGIYNCYSSPTLTHVTISENTATSVGGGIYNNDLSPTLTQVTISKNTAVHGGGIYNVNSSPTITNVTISGNTANGHGGGIFNEGNSLPTLANVTISENTAIQWGGGMLNNGPSSPTLINVTISGNTAYDGGGIYNNNASPTLTNVTISGNTANESGGGIFNSFNSITLTNVTISGNRATNGSGGGICNSGSSLQIYNSILWGNTANNNANIRNYGDNLSWQYSLVEGSGGSDSWNEADFGTDGGNNIDADPLFVSPLAAESAPTTAGDYRLQAASPAIGKGNNEYNLTTTDLDGNPRLSGASIDMGAYEYQIPIPDAAGILYVKDGGAGTKTGDSWANAYPNLAGPLQYADMQRKAGVASADAISRIWVAAGTYKPQYKAAAVDNNNDPTTDRDKAFVLVEGLKIYGGFPADANDAEHTTLASRTLSSPASQTILSGDIDGDEALSNADAYHVIIGANIADNSETILDGFTITGGKTNEGDSYISVNENSIYRNYGGGIHNSYSSPTLTNVTISKNAAYHGGYNVGNKGGGIYNDGSSPTLTNVTISENTGNYGGGICNTNSSPTLTNVTISGNMANTFSGGYFEGGQGGGIYNDSSSPTLTNVTISENGASGGGGICNYNNSSPTLTSVTISKNTAGYGGGIYNVNSSPTLTNVTISGNTANDDGGGIVNEGNSFPMLANVTISGNTAMDWGGGIFNNNASPMLTNVTIGGNTANNGGGIFNNNASPTLTNVTISGNTAIEGGGGIFNYSNSSPQIYNSILWGNMATGSGSNVYNYNSAPTYQYSLVEGSGGGWGSLGIDGGNNIDADPLFVSPVAAESAPTTAGDYRLQAASPAIDAGDNDLYQAASEHAHLSDVDIDGNPRLSGASIDLGAYEFFRQTWTGLSGNSWIEPANWNSGEAPDAASSVYIPGNLDTYPVLQEADAAVTNDIRFAPGAEIGRQDLLTYEKAYVQLDFSAEASRNRWYMLSSPLQELYAGDFSFGGFPGMDMNLFQADGNKTVWQRGVSGLGEKFKEGDGFLLWLAQDRAENKGLKLSKGIVELPYFDNLNVPADVHWTHTYGEGESTFKGWKEEGGSISLLDPETSVNIPRNLTEAYRLAGLEVNETLNFGQAHFAIAGNPYMSSIDFATLQMENPSVIKDTYYIWIGAGGNSTTYTPGSYAIYNAGIDETAGSPAIELDQNIAPMQSFIVEKSSDAGDAATLNFNLATIGVTDGSAELRSAAVQGDKLAIVASTAQAGIRTVIASRQTGNNSFGSADSRKLFDEINSIPEVYTLKPDANKAQVATAINVLGEITGETLVPLVISTTYKGELTFTFSGMDTYHARISLLDTERNTEIDLTGKAQYAYRFNYVPAQSGGTTVSNESRFFIRLNKVATGIAELAPEAVRIYASNSGTLQVVSTHPLRQVTVYNLQGARVYNAPIQTNTHKVDGLAAGVYLVKVVSGNTVTTEKVMVR